jgi:plastocyanin
MKKSYIVWSVVAVIVVAILGFVFWGNQSSPPAAPPATPPAAQTPTVPAATPQPTPQPVNGPAVPSSVTVTYTDNGFSPAMITVKKGDTVVFKNAASDDMWVASNPHPAHTGYPTTGGCRASTFDSCKGIAPGSSWSFTFTVVGTWGYHNHLNAGEGGKVVVQ